MAGSSEERRLGIRELIVRKSASSMQVAEPLELLEGVRDGS